MVKKSYIPEKGDVVWVDLNPTRGKEQSKVRPAIVVSPKSYNAKSGLAVMCPITSVTKGYPFEVQIKHKNVAGVVLSDHVRSLDWNERNVSFIARAKLSVINEVLVKLRLLI